MNAPLLDVLPVFMQHHDHAPPLVVHVPYLDLVVHAGRQEEVAVLWAEADRVDALRVARVRVRALLRDEASKLSIRERTSCIQRERVNTRYLPALT